MTTVGGESARAGSAPVRLGPDMDRLKKDAKGAIKAAVDALGLAASLTQNVPYLGAVSSALTVFLKIQDEANAVRDDWQSIIADAKKIKSIVDQTKREHERKEAGDSTLPQDLVEAFTELERCIFTSLNTLHACGIGSKRKRDRLRVLINRADLAGDVKKCGRDMSAALELFNTKLNIGTRLDVHELVAKYAARPVVPAVIISSAKLPPPAPEIFYGRAQEVDHILDLVLHKPPARVAILGPGGIGKTSIALTILHHHDVEAKYAKQRFFASCETVTSVEGVILELLSTFGVALDPAQGVQPQHALMNYLQGLSDTILCLDNLETIWDAETRATETLLSSLASFRHLALIITTRGSRRPMHVAWTHPYLPPITPLSFDAAIQTWMDICEVHDEFADKLVQGVDCMPLAVALLANLATSESPKVLWERWERDNLRVLHTHDSEDRLSNIEYSIELSLRGPRLRDEVDAVRTLGIICLLPQGLLESRVSVFSDAYTLVLPGFQRSISLLRQCSLMYLSENGFLRILSPIRHYVLSRYPLLVEDLPPLAKIYCDLTDHEVLGYGAMYSAHAEVHIRPEISNIPAVLRHCLNVQLSEYRERILEAIILFSEHCDNMSFHDVTLLDYALNFAQDYPHTSVRLLHMMGTLQYYSEAYSEAITTYTRAFTISRDSQNESDEARCMYNCSPRYPSSSINPCDARYRREVE